MELFIDSFFKSEATESKVKIEQFQGSTNLYLSEAFKKTFMQTNFVQTMSSFFN